MLRLCCSRPVVARGVATLPSHRSSRAYATAASVHTRSTLKGRRYYKDPLRQPQSGIRTVVGGRPDRDMEAMRPDPGDGTAVGSVKRKLTMFHLPTAPASLAATAPRLGTSAVTTRCLAVMEKPKSQLQRLFHVYGKRVHYNRDGVPVDGSWFLLPWREQLRIFAAVVAAFFITKSFFDLVHFDLLYYGLWKVGYRHEDSLRKRSLYYGSTVALVAGLVLSFHLNFLLSAWAVGRRELAAHLVQNEVALLVPQRTLHLFARRVGLTFV